MRVLHVIDSGGLYGAEVMLLHLMEEQKSLGQVPVLASIGEPGIGEKPVEHEAVRRCLQVETFRMAAGPNLSGALRILRYARREGMEVIHSHGYRINILFGLMPRLLRRLPMVTTVHGWTWSGGCNRMLVYEWLDGLSLRFVDKVVLVNGAMASHPRLRALAADQVTVVPNGIPLDPCPGEAALLRQDIVQFAGRGFSVVAVGRLSPEKGFGLLIDVLAGLVAEGFDMRLVILGEGKQGRALAKKAAELGIADRVLLAGYVDRAGEYLGFFDLFCMPSLTEGLPMVLLEAMLAGVPVVASRVGGIPEVLEQGRAGILVEAADGAALRQALGEAFCQPKSHAGRVRRAARRVREIYSSRVMAESYLAAYRQMVPRDALKPEALV